MKDSYEACMKTHNNQDELSESRLIRLAGLNESLEATRSEVSYSPTKAARHAFTKATRASAAGEIDSQLASMEPGNEDDRTIGDIVPIGYDEWESKKDIDKERREELQHDELDAESEYRSEALSYLKELALNVAEGTVAMSADDIQALDMLIMDEFQFQFGYAISGHAADLTADAQRAEYYDDYDASIDYDDKDDIVQELTEEQSAKQAFNESRLMHLAGIKQ